MIKAVITQLAAWTLSFVSVYELFIFARVCPHAWIDWMLLCVQEEILYWSSFAFLFVQLFGSFAELPELQMFIYIWILWILKKTYSLFFLFISFMLQILVSWFLLICWNKSDEKWRKW